MGNGSQISKNSGSKSQQKSKNTSMGSQNSEAPPKVTLEDSEDLSEDAEAAKKNSRPQKISESINSSMTQMLSEQGEDDTTTMKSKSNGSTSGASTVSEGSKTKHLGA